MHNFTLYDTRGELIRNTNHEAHEQFVVHRFLRRDDSVIELGGGIGTNSIQINLTLSGRARSNHYVFEPQAELASLVRSNGRLHGCKFKVVHGVLSRDKNVRVPVFNPDPKSWIFVRADASASGPIVPSVVTLPIHPTVIVADCEGCFHKVLLDFPDILRNIRMVYMENDGGREVLRGVSEILLARGMKQVVNTSHHKLFIHPSPVVRRKKSGRRSRQSPRLR